MLRVLALGLLAWAWLLSLGAVHRRVEAAGSVTLRARLERWSTVAPPLRVEVQFDAPPPVEERDWLAALRHAGTTVRWSGTAMTPTAAAVIPAADPAGGVEVAVAAPAGSTVVLRDALGVRDSVVARSAVLRFQLSRLEEGTSAAVGAVAAHDVPRDSLTFRHLLLLGRAGWEARFVSAAMTERGWVVDARFAVAPGGDVYQGLAPPRPVEAVSTAEPVPADPRVQSLMGMAGRSGVPGVPVAPSAPVADPAVRIEIDTARYSAVLAIDSTAARYGATIRRYVREGGGLVLWPEAAVTPAFRPIAPGGGAAARPEQPGAIADSLPREALGLVPISPLHPDAVVLESRGMAASIAARRIGHGRVVQIGYVDTWRWPMAGGETAPERYRAWLAGLIAQIAIVGRTPVRAIGSDPAPIAGLMERLGPPTSGSLTEGRKRTVMPWIFAILTLSLLMEWASRRSRGVR